ncbi:hypothetical protein HK405_015152, partial [Cladochytrium tenue]
MAASPSLPTTGVLVADAHNGDGSRGNDHDAAADVVLASLGPERAVTAILRARKAARDARRVQVQGAASPACALQSFPSRRSPRRLPPTRNLSPPRPNLIFALASGAGSRAGVEGGCGGNHGGLTNILRNNYAQLYLDVGARPQNSIRDGPFPDRLREYPRLHELAQLKAQHAATHAAAHPPLTPRPPQPEQALPGLTWHDGSVRESYT